MIDQQWRAARGSGGELPGIRDPIEAAVAGNTGGNAAQSRARDAFETRARAIQLINEREGNAASLTAEGLRGKAAGLFGRLRGGALARQIGRAHV